MKASHEDDDLGSGLLDRCSDGNIITALLQTEVFNAGLLSSAQLHYAGEDPMQLVNSTS